MLYRGNGIKWIYLLQYPKAACTDRINSRFMNSFERTYQLTQTWIGRQLWMRSTKSSNNSISNDQQSFCRPRTGSVISVMLNGPKRKLKYFARWRQIRKQAEMKTKKKKQKVMYFNEKCFIFVAMY